MWYTPRKTTGFAQHISPVLTPQRILGASVAVLKGEVFVLGKVTDLGRGGTACSDPSQPLTLPKPWRVEYDGVAPPGVPYFMSTEEVAAAATLRKAVEVIRVQKTDAVLSEKVKRLHAVEEQLALDQSFVRPSPKFLSLISTFMAQISRKFLRNFIV